MSQKQVYLVIDCETGGLNALENPITEIALKAIEKDTYKEINQYTTLIKPYADLKIEPEALKRTGITQEMLNSGRPMKLVIETIKEFCKSLTPVGDRGANKPIIVGHNVTFDIRFLKKAFELYNEVLFGHVSASTEDIKGAAPREGEINVIDTLTLSRELWGEKVKLTLGICCQRIGVSFTDSHRAMNDVNSTVKLLEFLIERLKSEAKVTKTVMKDVKRVVHREFFEY